MIPVLPMPQMSPTSRPTLSLSLTPTPTSSKFGCRSTSGITIFPTNPVPQTTTFFLSAMRGIIAPERPPRSEVPTPAEAVLSDLRTDRG